MSAAASVSGGDSVRRGLREAADAVGLRVVLLTAPGPEGEVIVCASAISASVREGSMLDPATPGLDEASLPIVDPGGGHVAGELRWIRGAARSELEPAELHALSACAEAVAAGAPAGAGPEEAFAHAAMEGPASSVMRLLAALATRSVKSAWEVDRVIQLSESVARELQLPEEAVDEVVQVAMLREVGNLGIPPRVLEKRGLLSRSEYRQLREQPILGERIVAAMPDLAYLAPLIRASQEQWDGSGYPDGLAGEQIPLASRIVSVCNAYVAMLCDRPFRKALPADAAQEIIDEKSGSQFCPISVAGLEKVLELEAEPGAARRRAAAEPAAPPAAAEPRRKSAAEHPRAPSIEPPSHEPASLKPPPGVVRHGHPAPDSGGGALRSARTSLARDRTPDRAMRLLYPIGLIVGTVLGVIVALPIDSAEGRCPPPGEARTQCILQKVWLHELTVVFVVAMATLLAGYILFFKLPDAMRRWRRGELFADHAPPPVSDDPAVLAATWGRVPDPKGRPRRRRPGPPA